MPLELPNLDDRTYDDLVQEALNLIPTYAPDWTNYNPSDPGITLIELFAYLSEMLIYRLNRVTDETLLTFLALLNGPDWTPTQDLRDEIRQSVLHLRSRYRAVTQNDYEQLSTENFNRWLAQMQAAETSQDVTLLADWQTVTGLDPAQPAHRPAKIPSIQRAHCVVERDLSLPLEADRQKPAPGHVSVVILPAPLHSSTQAPSAPPEVVPSPATQILERYLDERRLLTTRLHVVEPTEIPISAEILVAHYSDVRPDNLRPAIIQAINAFLSPRPGDNPSEAQGWPFGRDVYVSELYELLEKLPGIDYVPDILLTSQCPAADVQCVAAEAIWNQEGDQVGLKLYDHHLPSAQILPQQLVIVPNTKFRVFPLHWVVVPAEDEEDETDIAALKQRIKATVRSLLSTQRQQPNPEQQNPLRIDAIPSQNTVITFRITQLVRLSSDSQQYQDDRFETKASGPIPGVQSIRPSHFPPEGIRLYPDEVIDLRQQIYIEIL